MTGKARIFVMDLRCAPARDFEAIRQSWQATPPNIVMMQHDDGSLNNEALRTLCTDQANQGGYVLFNTRGRCAEQDLSWETSLESRLLDRFAMTHQVFC